MTSWRFSKILNKKAGLTIVIVLGLLLYYFISGRDMCVFKRITGIPCPGCGLTRGFTAILRLDFAAAFAYNLLAVPIFLAAVFLAACFLVKRQWFFRLMRIKIPMWGYITLAVITLISWYANIVRL